MVYSIGRWRAAGSGLAAMALSTLLSSIACSVGSSERAPESGGTSGSVGGGGGAGTGGSAGGGAGGGAGASGAGGRADAGRDTTDPYVLGVDVGDEGTRAGVRKDASIVISFSEPMDQVATQLAYQSADLPAATAVLTWDATGSVLTVDPSAELVYPAGTNPATVPAKRYSFTITNTARDLAGNALSAPYVGEFTTLRRITQKITLRAIEGTTITGDGTLYDCPTSFLIGDDAQNRPARGVLSFDIGALPTGITEFERATFSGQTQAFGGDPVASLQALVLEHTAFPLPITASARTASALGVVGVLTTLTTLRTSTVDVTRALSEDYQNRGTRGNRSQYRLVMQRPTDNDGVGDAMTLHCATNVPTLDMTYLVR